jgi:hypothetical protein
MPRFPLMWAGGALARAASAGEPKNLTRLTVALDVRVAHSQGSFEISTLYPSSA